MTERGDIELLDAWGSGDSVAARELIGRHIGALHRFFDRKVEGASDDLVQETLLGCLAGRDRIRGTAGFRGYLFGVARNVLFDHLRKRHRGPAPLDLESSCLEEIGPSPSQQVAQKREEQLLLAALRRLPVDTQVLLELYHWQGVSGPELAELYGLGERAVRSRLHRAKEELHEVMASVAETPELLASSIADFEAWGRALPKPESPQ